MARMRIRYRRAGRRGRRVVSSVSLTGIKRGVYRRGRRVPLMRKIQRALMANEETKYISSSLTSNFAANSTSGAGEGYSITGLAVPPQGTGVFGRTGNKWTVTGLHMNCRVVLQPQANTNFPITGQMLLVKLKEGGATFPWGDFLQQDPITGSYTMNSLRQVEHYTDFQILRKKRIYVAPDNFGGNTNGYSFNFNWKGICQQRSEPLNASVVAQNSLFVIFLADTGYLTGTGNNHLTVFSNYNIYYKDA